MSFRQISSRELPVWVKVLRQEGITEKMEMLDELNLIDDLLTLQKEQSLLNRKSTLKKQLEARIAKELGHSVHNLNVYNKQK